MRSLIALFALCGLCSAAELPISATYGTPIACAIYAEGGREAVMVGSSKAFSQEQALDDVPDYLVVSPAEVVTWESYCVPTASDGRVTLSCSGDDMTWAVNATITPKNDGENIVYQEGAGSPITLHKCPSSTEPGIM